MHGSSVQEHHCDIRHGNTKYFSVTNFEIL